MSTENKSTELEVMPTNAIESMERAAIDVQVSTAHAYPRSLKKFQTRALDMACIDEETAESCIYVRPVGGGKFAEGASIRLAEFVAASYGNIRVSARIIEQTTRFVRCEGVAHDLETNYAGKSEVIESTVKKDGMPYDERMRIVIAKACLAKAYRDAVFKVVPMALCKSVITAAKAVIAKTDIPLDERRQKVQAWVATLKIDEKRVLTALGVNGWPEVGVEQLTVLTGLRTTIRDGETTIDEAFPVGIKPADMTEKKAPSLFAMGGGVAEPQKPAPSTTPDLDLLRALMLKNDVSEPALLDYFREVGGVDSGLSSLAEIHEQALPAMQKAIKAWATVAKVIKGVK